MTNARTIQLNQAHWAQSIAEEAKSTACLTLGLTSGSRQGNDRRSIDRIVTEVANELGLTDASALTTAERMLVVRLEVHASRDLERAVDQSAKIPVPQRSPLGAWYDVSIPMPVGRRASWSLEQLPHWLPVWKNTHSLILLDLGPVNMVPSRMIGRLCDACYLVLGPAPCGSHEWIMQHIAWHQRSGSTVCGTIVASAA